MFASRDQQHLLSDLDDTHVVHADGGIEFLLWPGDLARLEATGLRFELLETPFERHAAESLRLRRERSVAGARLVAPGETTTGDYRHLADFNADMAALAEAYPTRCKLVELPFRTLDRRTVYGLEICDDVERYDGQPVFYNDGCHHAREFPAGEVPIMWAYGLLEAETLDDADPLAAARKQRLLTIRANVRNVVVPIVNVDGFDWSREFPVGTGGPTSVPAPSAPSSATASRRSPAAVATGARTAGSTSVRPSVRPTPPPRGSRSTPRARRGSTRTRCPTSTASTPTATTPSAWGGDGSSSIFESQVYRGSQPFSEQESRNVQHVFEKYFCLGSISHHTSGDLILWAWGDTRDDAPDNDLLEGMGRAMAEYNGYTPQKSIDLYVTTGTASDYMYGSRASISYTFEHAGSAFHPEYASTVPAMYEANRDAMMFLCEQSCLVPSLRPDYRDTNVLSAEANLRMLEQGVPLDQLNHAVIRGSMGRPGTVRITKRYETQLWVQDYENGSTGAENPLGQPAVEEVQDVSLRTAPDGSFELHVAPSTQPKVEFLGRAEAYDIAFIPDGGSLGASLRLVVRRGEVVDLGAIG